MPSNTEYNLWCEHVGTLLHIQCLGIGILSLMMWAGWHLATNPHNPQSMPNNIEQYRSQKVDHQSKSVRYLIWPFLLGQPV